ncbi:MAG TPA: hypothetical protein VEG44_03575 [Candidatus Acidoferrales bacterium]|nr:hypothetical protein [Candidatus Acidoferrales bacterium]
MITIFLRMGKSLKDAGDALNSRNGEEILEGQGQDRKTQNSSNRQIILALALLIAATVIAAFITTSIYLQNIIVSIGSIIGAIIVVVLIRKRL